jgi:urease accessory protein
MAASDWLIWQLADSAFPSGGFAHSGGLEAAWQYERVKAGESLHQWMRCQLHQVAHASAPFVASAHRHIEKFADWDTAADVFLSNHVANRASRAQGQALAMSLSRIFPQPVLTKLAAQIRAAEVFGHLAPTYGFICSEMGIALEQAVRLYLFLSLRGMISAAVRLGIAGPLEGQALQARLIPFAEGLIRPAVESSAENVVQTAPLLELLQGGQDRLYSRLFQS